MSKTSQDKLLEHLDAARANERSMARTLRAQVLVTPRGRLRRSLEAHAKQTDEHARRLQLRIDDLHGGDNIIGELVGFAASAALRAIAIGSAPLGLVRGGGEQAVLTAAQDDYAAEAREVAMYLVIEELAQALDDAETAALAASIRRHEEKMIGRLARELPGLARAAVDADVHGDRTYDPAQTGAADDVRAVGVAVRDSAHAVQARGRTAARKARAVPGVARAEGEIKGALASASDLPIAEYDELTAEDIASRLSALSQIDLAKVDAYERRGASRATVLARVAALRAQEPWPGYDELTVAELRVALGDDEDLAREVRAYERAHKNRAGVIDALERAVAKG